MATGSKPAGKAASKPASKAASKAASKPPSKPASKPTTKRSFNVNDPTVVMMLAQQGVTLTKRKRRP